jgi:dihydroorotate dehydrogenase electron transfer subunit
MKILIKKKINNIFACGPEMMLKKVVEIATSHRIKFQISLEEIVKCGLGICGSCTRGGKLICQDGPVFRKWP